MAKLFKIVEDHKASKWLRLANYFIDLLAFYLLILAIAAITGFILGYFTDVDIEALANDIENMNSILQRILGLLAYGLFMFLTEFISKGRSLGKLITGTQVVKTDASPLTFQDYFFRNISRAIPFDQLSFLGNNEWHDTIYYTRVVKKKKFEEAQNLQQDLNDLGNQLDQESLIFEKTAETYRKF